MIKKGYLRVCLTLKNSQKYTAKVHRLVASAFIPNPCNKPTVNHLNGIHDCNIVSNLEWATNKEQSEHAIRTGLVPESLKCENSPTSLYTNEQIHLVCKLLSEDLLHQREISRITGVSHDTVNKIRKGKAWKDISRQYNISSKNKLQNYSIKFKTDIVCLLGEHHTAPEIIHILNLPNTQASVSLIYNLKRKSKID